MLKRTCHRRFSLTQIERLHQIVERPEPQGLDCALDCLHATDHYNHGVRRNSLDVRNHVQTTYAAHRNVADDQSEIAFAQTLKRFFGR